MTLGYISRDSNEVGCLAHALGRDIGLNGLTQAADNARPSEGSYICLVPVHDYWAMGTEDTRRAGVRHYSNVLEEELLQDVRDRRCAIVFDLTTEGPSISYDYFAELLTWMEVARVPPGMVVWVSQNRALRKEIRDWAGERRDWLVVENYDFFVKMAAASFSPLSGGTVYGEGVEAHIERMFDPAQKDRLLLCLNATPRHHRLLMIGALIHHGLMDESLVSFPGPTSTKLTISKDEMLSYLGDRPALDFLRPELEAIFALGQLKVDSFAETGNSLVDKIDALPYIRTFFSIVTETELTEGSVQRITEKTVKPYSLGHPTLVLGNPNSTRFMTELGFQSWSDIIGEAHDSEKNHVRRFSLLVDEALRQVGAIRSAPSEWLGRAREIGSSNARHAASGNLLRSYQDVYDKPLLKRLAALVSA